MPTTYTDLPQHRQVYEALKRDIEHGIYVEGNLLPSENTLCQAYAVTRPTVRQALHALTSEGFIKKQQGKGSIVQPLKQGIGVLSIVRKQGIPILSRTGTTDSLLAGHLETRVIEDPSIGEWHFDFDYDITEKEREAGCIRMSRLRLIDGRPILYEITNLPNIQLPDFCQQQFENESLFGILSRHYNLKIRGGEQKIQVGIAHPDIQTLLNVDPHTPLLHLQKRYETSRPDYHFYTVLWSNTTDYYLEGNF